MTTYLDFLFSPKPCYQKIQNKFSTSTAINLKKKIMERKKIERIFLFYGKFTFPFFKGSSKRNGLKPLHCLMFIHNIHISLIIFSPVIPLHDFDLYLFVRNMIHIFSYIFLCRLS